MSYSKDFVWGTATASYQVEGAWDEDGRKPSVWDIYSHQAGNIKFNHIYRGGTIGNKKICQLQNPFEEQNPLLSNKIDTNKLKIKISSSRSDALIKDIKVY